MAKPLLTDEFWEIIEPLLPPPKPRRKGGRPPVPNRNALTGILFVLKTGIGWEDLPQEIDCGSGMTCWRRLRDWQRAGVWDKLHATLLAKLHAADQIDWSRAIVDSSSVRAVFGGRKSARTPRIAGKKRLETPRDLGCERHSTRCYSDWGQSPRRDSVAPAGRRNPAGTWKARPSASSSRHGPGGPRLRFEWTSPSFATARRDPSDRPPLHR